MKRSRDDVFASSQLKRPLIPTHADPSGQAQMSTASSAQKLTTTHALTYLKAVKEIFQDKKDKYEEFLAVMKDFKAQRIDTTGVISRVKELFKGHRELILGFNAFLPKGYEITLSPEEEPFMRKKPVEFEEAISFVNKIKTRFHGDDHVYKSFLEILNLYRKDNKLITEVYQEVSNLFQDHADLLVEFTHFLPDTSGAASMHLAQPGRNQVFGDERGSPMTVPRSLYVEKYTHHPDSEWNQVEKEKEKREGRDDNEWEHNDSPDHRRKSARLDDSATEGMLNPVSAICEKVKGKLQDHENYQKFLDCVRSYESKFVTTPQFRMLTENLLGSYPDLMEECEALITYIEKIGCLRNNKHMVKSLKIEDRDGDHHDRETRDRNKDPETRERDRGLIMSSKDAAGQKMPSYASKEKFMTKPIQELDLSNCESCTPSYRLLPDNYPIPLSSRRTEIGVQVLNDHWVSVTSGSEDYSFKHMRKNQYEESLFRCEDDRFELDMLLESVNATTKRVEELLNSMNDHTIKTDSTFCVEDHLTALNLRCIERLYGDHGLDVMDVLRKNAPLALPVILTRLKQKQEEWAKCRADFNKVWAEIYAKNYHKSLDHRSFYFKQQDTKNLSAKVLLAEIKEISEKNQNEDEIILSIGAGYRQTIRPDMEFEYPDPDIQEDLYQLMKFSCKEVCTSEQHDKVMKVWTTFLETVLGVPSRLINAQVTGNPKMDGEMSKTVASVGEGNPSPAGEAASGNCKPLELSKDVDENNPTEQSISHDTDNVTRISEISCAAEHNQAKWTDVNMTSAMSSASKQDGFLDQGTANATAEMSANDGNASGPQNGGEGASLKCAVEPIPTNEQQDAVSNLSTGMEIQETKPQESHEEIEAFTKNEQLEGNLSRDQNPEEKKNSSVGNASVKSPCKSATSARGIGGEEMCIEEAEGETDANADDEGEGSARGSSDSENASENGDVSASESADAEECCLEEPDEDRDDNDNKAESEGEADGVTDDHDNEGQLPLSSRLQKMKPLNIKIPLALLDGEKNSQIFYGNDSFYILFRLHQILYERMRSAKLHSTSPENKWRSSNDANLTDSYARFKDALCCLLNGSSDNAKFEDDCRSIIGAQSYVLFTLDKLIHKLVKQLQLIATEDIENRLLQLYAYERSRNPENFADAVYYENARFIVPDDNLYRIECLRVPARLTIQLMNNEHDKPEVAPVSMDPNFASYLNEELLSVITRRKGKPRVYLMRNRRRLLTGDEVTDYCNVTEELINYNGLEIKIDCNTFKAAYVLDTEDFMYRPMSRRKVLYGIGSSSGASNGASNGATNGLLQKGKRKLMFS